MKSNTEIRSISIALNLFKEVILKRLFYHLILRILPGSNRAIGKCFFEIFISFCLLTIISCNKSPVEEEVSSDTETDYTINGYIQKGPFIIGSTVTLYALDANLNQTGKSYSTSTTDNLGSFQLVGKFKKNSYVEIVAAGYYYDEIAGELSDSTLTLRTLGRISSNDSININILTSLETERLRYLLQGGATFAAAKTEAKSNVLDVFGITDEILADFQKMDITNSGTENAVLLAVSSTLLQVAHSNASSSNNRVAELSASISNIITDIKSDGVLDSTVYQSRISAAKRGIDTGVIRQHLEARYAELGMTITIPDLDAYVGNPWSQIKTLESPSGMACVAEVCYLLGPFATFKKINLTTLELTALTDMPFSHGYGYAKPVTVGTKIYFVRYVGGSNNEMWEYDTSSATWTQKASSNTNHQHAWSSVVYNDKVYVFGDNSTTSVEVYDPATNQWANLTSLPASRIYPSAAVYSDKIYIGGRENLPIEIYDSSTNGYNSLAISNETVDSAPYLQILTAFGTVMYVTTATSLNYNKLWKYTFATDSWTEMVAPPQNFDPRATYVLNNKLYLLSGNLYVYNPAKE